MAEICSWTFQELDFANQGGEVSGTRKEGLLGWDRSATIGGLNALCLISPSRKWSGSQAQRPVTP